MLFYIAVTSLLLALLLLINNFKKNKTAVFIAVFFIIISIYGITHYFAIYGKDPFYLAIFYIHFTPLYLLLGPLLFFYVRGTLNDSSRLSKTDFLHFLPAIIQGIGITPYVFKSFSSKIEKVGPIIENVNAMLTLAGNTFYDARISSFLRLGMLLVYILFCAYLLLVNIPILNTNKTIPKKQYHISFQWMVILLASLLVITVIFIVLTIKAVYLGPAKAFKNSYFLQIFSGISYCCMVFSLLLFPNILYGIPRVAKENKIDSQKKKHKTKITQDRNKLIQEKDPFIELSEKIKTYLQNEKPYLNPDFSISTIVLRMEIPQTHVSYCINALMNTTFYQLRSKLRVAYATSLLQSDTKRKFTIEAIGEKSGFKTRSNFYSTFKEVTGITPTVFMDQNS